MGFRCLILAILAVVLVLQPACSTRSGPKPEIAHPAIPDDLVLIRSKDVRTAESAHLESASITISDPKGLAGQFHERLEQMLVAKQFTLTDQPSLAERIISLKILFKGSADRTSMEQAVRAGYDTAVPELTGSGSVLVADLLLVRRRVPSQTLNTISARNAMSSTTLRIGLFSSKSSALKDRSLEEALARDIAALAASDEDEEVHKTSSLTLQKKSKVTQKKASVKKRKAARKSSAKSSKSSKRSSAKKR